MTLEAELILPPDVKIFPVRDLAPHIRAKLDAVDDDYAITRPRSRVPSRIIDKDSADLLAQFRSPTRIANAVLLFARQRGLDPETTLEKAYPLFSRLCQSKVLVPAQSTESNAIESKFKVGAVLDDFRLLRCVQVLDDTEVFLARNSSGRYAAVKFSRHGTSRLVKMLKHEAMIMRRVGPPRAPEVLCITRSDSGIALITEWVFGLDAANTAAGIRGRREPRSEKRLLRLCIEIVQAFADIHCSGVLHGDIHPRNILVEPNGSVTLIDFGLAQVVDQAGEHAPRGGVAFYFDPEFASAQRNHLWAPLTAAGEQYSVASLLYELWTGVHYVDWRLERDEMLRQISEEDPLSFEARCVPPWRELEQTLCRALQKRPEGRFSSMCTFAEALRKLLPQAEARDRPGIRQSRELAREDVLLERALSRYAYGVTGLVEEPANFPLASINYGAGGISYTLYRIALCRGDARLLSLSDVWVQKAFALCSHERAFHNPDFGIDRETVGDVSLFHSASGLRCVRALVSIALGAPQGAHQAIQSFIEHSRRPCKSPDLTLGSASLLLGCAEIVEALSVQWLVDVEPVRRRGNEIASELARLLKLDSIPESTRIPSLGVAHGWAGLLFALLRWSKATGTAPDQVVSEKLGELASLAEPHGGGVRWSVHNTTREPTFMDGWCNGTAGHVMLFSLAYDVLGIGAFGELAECAAESAWASEVQLGTLCCGLAGIGYAFAAAYRLTGAQRWLDRARMAARRAAADGSKGFLRDSLYKGALGVALLAEDLKQPNLAAMPLFEPTS
jgi:hypothetical protein